MSRDQQRNFRSAGGLRAPMVLRAPSSSSWYGFITRPRSFCSVPSSRKPTVIKGERFGRVVAATTWAVICRLPGNTARKSAVHDGASICWNIPENSPLFPMGGGIALGFALDTPDCVERLALIDSACLSDAIPGGPLGWLFAHLPGVAGLGWRLMRSSPRMMNWAIRRAMPHRPDLVTSALLDAVMRLARKPGAGRATLQRIGPKDKRFAGRERSGAARRRRHIRRIPAGQGLSSASRTPCGRFRMWASQRAPTIGVRRPISLRTYPEQTLRSTA